MDDQSGWLKQVLIGVVVLLAVGALIGGIVSLVSIKAADLAGIGDDGPTNARTTIQTKPDATDSGPPRTRPTNPKREAPRTGPRPPTDRPKPKPRPERQIQLDASPTATGTYQRIDLTGTYPAPEGTTLQVQRREAGAWADFPTTASVTGGAFTTYVETGRTGLNMFRVSDTGSGRSSNTVQVRVR